MSFVQWNRESFEAIFVRELERRGLTAAEWAREQCISPGYLHELRFPKAGRRKNPSNATVKKLADALGVPIGAIKSGEPVPA